MFSLFTFLPSSFLIIILDSFIITAKNDMSRTIISV